MNYFKLSVTNACKLNYLEENIEEANSLVPGLVDI